MCLRLRGGCWWWCEGTLRRHAPPKIPVMAELIWTNCNWTTRSRNKVFDVRARDKYHRDKYHTCTLPTNEPCRHVARHLSCLLICVSLSEVIDCVWLFRLSDAPLIQNPFFVLFFKTVLLLCGESGAIKPANQCAVAKLFPMRLPRTPLTPH